MKPIPGYEGLYSVTENGEVWRYEKKTKRRHSATWLKRCKDSDGYLCVTLFKDGVKKMHKVHRLVAMAYLGYEPNGPLWVLHKNDQRDDPRACNLFLGTPKDNQQDCIRKGRKTVFHGSSNPAAKLTSSMVESIRCDHRTQREIALDYGICQVQVSRIKSFKRWKTVSGAA